MFLRAKTELLGLPVPLRIKIIKIINIAKLRFERKSFTGQTIDHEMKEDLRQQKSIHAAYSTVPSFYVT